MESLHFDIEWRWLHEEALGPRRRFIDYNKRDVNCKIPTTFGLEEGSSHTSVRIRWRRSSLKMPSLTLMMEKPDPPSLFSHVPFSKCLFPLVRSLFIFHVPRAQNVALLQPCMNTGWFHNDDIFRVLLATHDKQPFSLQSVHVHLPPMLYTQTLWIASCTYNSTSRHKIMQDKFLL